MARRLSWKLTLLQAGKVALGAGTAILLAQGLGLKYAMTAGIIAVLSIQGTKQETWRLAGERVLAFLCAAAIGFGCFSLLGYTLAGFTVYLLLFAALCVCLHWMHALAMISVLITHFVSEGGMTPAMLGNEALLLVVGALCGMAVNLHLMPDEKRMCALREKMDGGMVAALQAAADAPREMKAFETLRANLDEAEELARRNQANRLKRDSGEELAYVLLRKRQYREMMRLRQAMAEADAAVPQYQMVRALLHRVAADYHRENDVAGLLAEEAAVLAEMKRQPLPENRAEFESRALLYGALLYLENFLEIKREYYQKWFAEK